MITSVPDAPTNDVTLVPQPADGQPHGPAQFPDIGATDVPHLHPLPVVPDTLIEPNLTHLRSFNRGNSPLFGPRLVADRLIATRCLVVS